MKKASKAPKETFFVKRVTITEVSIEILAASEAEAVEAVAEGRGEEFYRTTHVCIKADNE